MTDSSHSSIINTYTHIIFKTKAVALLAVVLFFMLLVSRLWADNRKEYIYLDGKAVAVEAETFVNCTYEISSVIQNPGAGGESSNVSVTSSHGSCMWTTISDALWITVTGGSSVTGDGIVSYTVSANNTGSARQGIITIAENNFIINQVPCSQTLSLPSKSVDFVGGTGLTIGVTSETGCAWTAVSDVNNASWIAVTSGGSGNGNGTVSYKIDANPGVQRDGAITIGNKEFPVTQGANCQLHVNASEAQCSGLANDLASSSTVCVGQCQQQYYPACNIDPNVCAPCVTECQSSMQQAYDSCMNQYNISVASCNASCGYALSLTSKSFLSSGGSGTFDVTSAACSWTAVSNAPPSNKWLQATSGASGTGNGSVGYSVSQNNGTARAATLKIADKTFTVSQADGCTYSISGSTSANPTSVGGGGTVTLNRSDASCISPSVTSNAGWITDAAVNSSGNVSYTVEGNTGPSARIGTITVAGQTFTITQSACTYGISPTNAYPSAVGGSGYVVTVNPSSSTCAWTAASNATSWIPVTSGSSGTGTGNVTYSVTANTGPARSDSIIIAGNTFPINQADGCTYAFPSSQPTIVNPESSGGGGSVSVNCSNANCTPVIANVPSWVTNVTVSGSGTAKTVNYTVAAHTGPARSAIITIGGNQFTINQKDGCAYTLSPTSSGTINISGGIGSFTVLPSNNACTWTTSKPSWVTITGGSSGTGNGTVSYSVGNNSYGPARDGAISVGVKNYTISQDGMACNQYCTQLEQSCMGGCAGQCQAQLPQECIMYPAVCFPYYQACVDDCSVGCSYIYSNCMASCQ